MLIEAKGLQDIDEAYKIHLAAWANVRAEETENKGTEKKPKIESKYKTFNEFFNYEGMIDSFWGRSTEEKKDERDPMHDKKLMQLLKKANTKGGNEWQKQ